MKTEKIFVVDDNELTALMYAEFIRGLGYKDVTEYNSGLDCLNALTDEPDIVFLDHQMDDMQGLEVLTKIKRFNPDIYVVFVSGQEEIETATKSLKNGAFDYIIKGPRDTHEISAVLQKINNVKDLLAKRGRGPLRQFLGFFL